MLCYDAIRISLYFGLYIQKLLIDEILLYDFDFFNIISFLKAHRHTIKQSCSQSRVLVFINIPQHVFVDSIRMSLSFGLKIQKLLLDEILLYDCVCLLLLGGLDFAVTFAMDILVTCKSKVVPFTLANIFRNWCLMKSSYIMLTSLLYFVLMHIDALKTTSCSKSRAMVIINIPQHDMC